MASAAQQLKVAFSAFSTDQRDAPDRFDAWRESIGVIFEVEPPGRKLSPAFTASVRTYHLGEMLVSGTGFGDQEFKRDLRRISADGLDHYLVQLYYAGGLVGSTRQADMNVRPGDIQILDLAQPHVSSARNSSTIVITVQRDLMERMLPPRVDPHGVVLRGDRGTGALLADYMASLFRRLDSVDEAEAPFVANATSQMIAACLAPSIHTAARARAQIEGVIADRIKRHIEANVGSRDLSPAALCARFRISRAQLYRVFEPVGGVAGYVQARRLDHALARLRDPAHRGRRVFEIAYEAGFSSIAHFSAAFRRQFGFSPSDVRAEIDSSAIDHGHAPNPGLVSGYENWIRWLGRRPSPNVISTDPVVP
ncbi:MAG TPA: helix-turn-helix domain-containing protein [Candidatus Binataceae bacterium]|nr:helix-turn-helix domain-containing protein [Candidatus Binataceae bacterium]